MSNETLDEAGVLAKFDVRADQVLDLLTLTGDTVDNVPGVPKVGPKTAAKWLAQYGSLDNIVAHADEIPGVVGENLRAALDWLPQGKRLLTVKTDCELPVAPAELQLAAARRATLRRAVRALRVQELAARLAANGADNAGRRRRDREAARRATTPGGAGTTTLRRIAGAARRRRETHYEMVVDAAALARWLAAIDAAELVAFDTETTSLDPMQARIVGVSLSVEPGTRLLHPARAPLRRRAGPARSRRDARAPRAVARRSRAEEARPEPQVRPACARQSRPGAARRRARHAARVVRAGIAQAARHGQPRVAASER